MQDRNVHFKTCIPCVTERRGVFCYSMEILTVVQLELLNAVAFLL